MKNFTYGNELTPETAMQELWVVEGIRQAVVSYINCENYPSTDVILAMLQGDNVRKKTKEEIASLCIENEQLKARIEELESGKDGD